MFTTGITAFYLLTLMLKIVLGAVALTLACLWAPQRGKVLFCIFIGTAFLAGPILDIAMYSLVLFNSYPGYFNGQNFGRRTPNAEFWMFVMQVMGWARFLFEFVGFVLLIVYAAVRYQVRDSNLEQHSESTEPDSLVPVRRWDTHLPANQLIQIARRREWGHGIDCLPALLFFCLFVWMLGAVVIDSSYRSRLDQRELVWMLMVAVSLGFLVYLLMKDCIGGVSIGKWFTGCRVVDAASGRPASIPQAMLRNVIFLLFPLGSVIELVVTNFRPDRRRFGDLWAGTMVVQGPANIVDGVRVKEEAQPDKPEEAPKKHPLDD